MAQVLDAVLLPEGHADNANDIDGPAPARIIYPDAPLDIPTPAVASSSATGALGPRYGRAMRTPYRAEILRAVRHEQEVDAFGR